MDFLQPQHGGPSGGSCSPASQTDILLADSAAVGMTGPSQPAQSSSLMLDSMAIYQGKGYLLTSVQTWEDAQAEALGLNGNLVAINDAAEEAWLKETFGQEQTLWIGLTDRDEEGHFRWMTGESLDYQNWALGQPDNHPNIEREDYAVLNFRDTSQWNDASALSTYRGIIEIDLSSSEAPSNSPAEGTSEGDVMREQQTPQETPSVEQNTSNDNQNAAAQDWSSPEQSPAVEQPADESPEVVSEYLPEASPEASPEAEVELDDVTGTWEPYRFWGQENFSLVPQSEAPQFSDSDASPRLMSTVDSPDPVLRISMPAGSASPAVSQNAGRPLGGGEFLGHLRGDSVERLRLRYRLRFSEDFDFVKGGKLPGLYGGTAPSGGNIPDGTDGFSTRFMWREDGAGEVYAYLPDSQEYGTSLGRGQWQFVPGTWQTLEQELILNDPGQANGQLKVWLDGQVVFSATDLQFRTEESLKINGIYVSSFFGGGDTEYATPRDVHIDFADFEVWEP